jgi:PPOX class probable F420-dependent enzyme
MKPAAIPDSHRDLLERPINATLVTVMPSGQPQATVVWCGLEGPYVMLSTMRGFQKERNMRARPKVSLVVVDPDSSGRWIEVRGTVELIDSGALADLDELTALYAGVAHYFGDVVPAELAETEIPVTCRITPTRVRAEAF